jgi:hypothetical protein
MYRVEKPSMAGRRQVRILPIQKRSIHGTGRTMAPGRRGRQE